MVDGWMVDDNCFLFNQYGGGESGFVREESGRSFFGAGDIVTVLIAFRFGYGFFQGIFIEVRRRIQTWFLGYFLKFEMEDVFVIGRVIEIMVLVDVKRLVRWSIFFCLRILGKFVFFFFIGRGFYFLEGFGGFVRQSVGFLEMFIREVGWGRVRGMLVLFGLGLYIERFCFGF